MSILRLLLAGIHKIYYLGGDLSLFRFRNNADKKAYEKAYAKLKEEEKIKNQSNDDRSRKNSSKRKSQGSALTKSDMDVSAANGREDNTSGGPTIERYSVEKGGFVKNDTRPSRESGGGSYNPLRYDTTRNAMTEVVDIRSYKKPTPKPEEIHDKKPVEQNIINRVEEKPRLGEGDMPMPKHNDKQFSKDEPPKMESYFEKFLRELDSKNKSTSEVKKSDASASAEKDLSKSLGGDAKAEQNSESKPKPSKALSVAEQVNSANKKILAERKTLTTKPSQDIAAKKKTSGGGTASKRKSKKRIDGDIIIDDIV